MVRRGSWQARLSGERYNLLDKGTAMTTPTKLVPNLNHLSGDICESIQMARSGQ